MCAAVELRRRRTPTYIKGGGGISFCEWISSWNRLFFPYLPHVIQIFLPDILHFLLWKSTTTWKSVDFGRFSQLQWNIHLMFYQYKTAPKPQLSFLKLLILQKFLQLKHKSKSGDGFSCSIEMLRPDFIEVCDSTSSMRNMNSSSHCNPICNGIPWNMSDLNHRLSGYLW